MTESEALTVLESALARVGDEHATVLEWFISHEGSVGPRPWRHQGRSVVPGVTIPLVAQRGIHRPSGWSHAVSVTAAPGDAYLDGKPSQLNDGTWILPYKAHAGGDGTGVNSRWNRALLSNMIDRIPVGAFVHANSNSYLNLGLAMVEDYYEDQGTFLLRGPVRYAQPASIWSGGDYASEHAQLIREESAADDRVMAIVQRRIAQDRFRGSLLEAYGGRCAVTGYDAESALQAAHIVAYSGESSQRTSNGLLLRADIHLLYDRHLISIDPSDSLIRLSDGLRGTYYSELHGKPLWMPPGGSERPDAARLAVHFAVFAGR